MKKTSAHRSRVRSWILAPQTPGRFLLRGGAIVFVFSVGLYAYSALFSFGLSYHVGREWREFESVSASERWFEEAYVKKLNDMRAGGGATLGLVASGAPHYIESFAVVAKVGM